MEFQNEEHRRQNELAAALAKQTAMHFVLVQAAFPEAGQKTTLAMSSAMIGIESMASLLSHADLVGAKHVPTPDQIQFACMFLANSASFTEQGGLLVAFDFSSLDKTLEQFQTMFGRSFEPQLDQSLKDAIDEERKTANKAFRGEMTKFLPH
jgi:hypothetical protein